MFAWPLSLGTKNKLTQWDLEKVSLGSESISFFVKVKSNNTCSFDQNSYLCDTLQNSPFIGCSNYTRSSGGGLGGEGPCLLCSLVYCHLWMWAFMERMNEYNWFRIFFGKGGSAPSLILSIYWIPSYWRKFLYISHNNSYLFFLIGV